jgi:hypothetical protein
MSISHSIDFWLHKYLPDSVVKPFRDRVKKTGLWDRSIGLNIGDIVAVVARKPAG